MPTKLIVGAVSEVKTKSIIIFVVVLCLSVLLAGAVTFLCVTLPLRRLSRALDTGKSPTGASSLCGDVDDVRQRLLGNNAGEMTSARK